MNSAAYDELLKLLEAMDKTISYTTYQIMVHLESQDELKKACSTLIEKDLDFKILSGYRVVIYHGK